MKLQIDAQGFEDEGRCYDSMNVGSLCRLGKTKNWTFLQTLLRELFH